MNKSLPRYEVNVMLSFGSRGGESYSWFMFFLTFTSTERGFHRLHRRWYVNSCAFPWFPSIMPQTAVRVVKMLLSYDFHREWGSSSSTPTDVTWRPYQRILLMDGSSDASWDTRCLLRTLANARLRRKTEQIIIGCKHFCSFFGLYVRLT